MGMPHLVRKRSNGRPSAWNLDAFIRLYIAGQGGIDDGLIYLVGLVVVVLAVLSFFGLR